MLYSVHNLTTNYILHSLKCGCVLLSCTGLFTSNDIQSMMDEVLKMQSFDHPHVMTLIGVHLDVGPGLALVIPYTANVSLLAYLKNERSRLV